MHRVLVMSSNVQSKVLLLLIFSQSREEVETNCGRSSLLVGFNYQLGIGSEESEPHSVFRCKELEVLLGFEIPVKLEGLFGGSEDTTKDIFSSKRVSHQADN